MKQDIDTLFPTNSFNARLLFKEMARRGVKLTRIRKTRLAYASFHNHSELFYDVYSNVLPYTKGVIIDDKYHSKMFLQEKGFSVNRGNVFLRHDISSALRFAASIGFPVVIKPVMSSHGENVVMNIYSIQELRTSLASFYLKYREKTFCLVEKQFKGNEYRLFITNNDFFAAVQRIPASIRCDGKHTIRELIKQENFTRMHPRNTCLCKITVDALTIRELDRQYLNLSSIPPAGTRVRLRANSNVSTGGNCVDVTERVHSSYVMLARKILRCLDIPFIGIDLLCDDISLKMKNYAICELNSFPGISLHMMPENGKCRDVARAIIDVIFPETQSLWK